MPVANCNDFDGDKIADLIITDLGRKIGDSLKYHLILSNGQQKDLSLGKFGDLPAPADYDGDGKTDPAFIRGTRTSTSWTTLLSSTSKKVTYTLDKAIDYSISGCDFDGDKKSDIAGLDEELSTLNYGKSSKTTTTGVHVNLPKDGVVKNLSCADINGDGYSDLLVVSRTIRSVDGSNIVKDHILGFDIKHRGKRIFNTSVKGRTVTGIFTAQLTPGALPTVASFYKGDERGSVVNFYLKPSGGISYDVETLLVPPVRSIGSVGGALVYILSKTGEVVRMDLVKESKGITLGSIKDKAFTAASDDSKLDLMHCVNVQSFVKDSEEKKK